jgi:hypothetical protein
VLSFVARESFAAGESGLNDASVTVAARPALNAPAFRLGDAARPFDWSTVVSDFNHDGVPDLAIADRAPRHGNEFGYDIQFAVAGRKPYDVTFTSPLQAVALESDDVDGDRDSDILVVDPVSNDVVGVWLNDGDGHFQPADPRSFSTHHRSILDPSVRTTDGIGAGVSRERNPYEFSASFDEDARPSARARFQRVSPSLASFHDNSSVRPRAPPALHS